MKYYARWIKEISTGKTGKGCINRFLKLTVADETVVN